MTVAFDKAAQRLCKGALAGAAQGHERRIEFLAGPLGAQAGVVTDTTDGAEDAVDRRQQLVEPLRGILNSAVVVQKGGVEAGGNAAQSVAVAMQPAVRTSMPVR